MNNLIYIALPKISCFCSAFWVVSLLLLRLEKKRKIEPRKILSPRQQFPMLDAIDDSVSFTWFYLFEISWLENFSVPHMKRTFLFIKKSMAGFFLIKIRKSGRFIT